MIDAVIPLVLALVAGVAVVVLGATAALGLRVRRLVDQVERVGPEQFRSDLEAQLAGLKRDYAAFLEDADSILESVERKRRRTAAAASKVNETYAAPAVDRRTELLRMARERGLL